MPEVKNEMWDWIAYSVLVDWLLPRPPEEILKIVALAQIKLIASEIDDEALRKRILDAVGDPFTDAIRKTPELRKRLTELADKVGRG